MPAAGSSAARCGESRRLTRPNKTGTGSEPIIANPEENARREVPVPVLLGPLTRSGLLVTENADRIGPCDLQGPGLFARGGGICGEICGETCFGPVPSTAPFGADLAPFGADLPPFGADLPPFGADLPPFGAGLPTSPSRPLPGLFAQGGGICGERCGETCGETPFGPGASTVPFGAGLPPFGAGLPTSPRPFGAGLPPFGAGLPTSPARPLPGLFAQGGGICGETCGGTMASSSVALAGRSLGCKTDGAPLSSWGSSGAWDDRDSTAAVRSGGDVLRGVPGRPSAGLAGPSSSSRRSNLPGRDSRINLWNSACRL